MSDPTNEAGGGHARRMVDMGQGGGWTLDTLKSYFEAVLSERDRAVLAAFTAQKSAIDAALAAQEKAVAAALAAADRAVAKAEAAAERRFEGVNEFRGQLADQQRNLMPRAEADVEFRALREKMDALTTRVDKGEGKGAGLDAGWGYLIGGVGLLLTLLTIGSIVFALTR